MCYKTRDRETVNIKQLTLKKQFCINVHKFKKFSFHYKNGIAFDRLDWKIWLTFLQQSIENCQTLRSSKRTN